MVGELQLVPAHGGERAGLPAAGARDVDPEDGDVADLRLRVGDAGPVEGVLDVVPAGGAGPADGDHDVGGSADVRGGCCCNR